ncbi:MAG: hypothetical protein IPJ69_02360 [Deltaproteobacteria bacterium]|nr:MAG: hypothetical protein IPJ69_02360 [Deltaproteobacteria bacterium]
MTNINTYLTELCGARSVTIVAAKDVSHIEDIAQLTPTSGVLDFARRQYSALTAIAGKPTYERIRIVSVPNKNDPLYDLRMKLAHEACSKRDRGAMYVGIAEGMAIFVSGCYGIDVKEQDKIKEIDTAMSKYEEKAEAAYMREKAEIRDLWIKATLGDLGRDSRSLLDMVKTYYPELKVNQMTALQLEELSTLVVATDYSIGRANREMEASLRKELYMHLLARRDEGSKLKPLKWEDRSWFSTAEYTANLERCFNALFVSRNENFVYMSSHIKRLSMILANHEVVVRR